jgi:hypothetical protein
MSTIQLEVSSELAEKLRPYRDKLVELLELGLQQWQEREQQDQKVQQEQLLQVLAASGKVTLPQPYTGEKPYVRGTPVPITGKPVSKIVSEQRGPL